MARWLRSLKGKFVYRGPKPYDPDRFTKATGACPSDGVGAGIEGLRFECSAEWECLESLSLGGYMGSTKDLFHPDGLDRHNGGFWGSQIPGF